MEIWLEMTLGGERFCKTCFIFLVVQKDQSGKNPRTPFTRSGSQKTAGGIGGFFCSKQPPPLRGPVNPVPSQFIYIYLSIPTCPPIHPPPTPHTTPRFRRLGLLFRSTARLERKTLDSKALEDAKCGMEGCGLVEGEGGGRGFQDCA